MLTAGAGDLSDQKGPDAEFHDRLAAGRIDLPLCLGCGRFHFYPRLLCPHCGDTELAWQTASGRGEVYSTTVVRRKPERGGDYNVCVIDLAEGVRMMTRVDGIAPTEVRIGMAITAHVGEIDGTPAVLCKPAEG